MQTPSHDCKYEAFISYRHIDPDYSAAKNLHKMLERFRIPASVRRTFGRRKIDKIFRDQEELPTSSDLGQDIENALRDSRWLIVVCSPRMPLSKWCMREIDLFIEMGRRDRILTLLIEGEPGESFPEQLRFVQTERGVIEREPLAADIRAKSEGGRQRKLKVEKLRLLAPMLGVGFDDLRQRMRARFIQKALTAAAASVAVLAVFGGVLFYQWNQTRTMESVAAVAQISDLVGRSQIYRVDGQQARAILAAAEALRTADSRALDSLDPQAALYNAIVNAPGDKPYARLAHGGEIQTAAFSRDGSRLATLSNDTTVTVWETRTAKQITVAQLPDSINTANALRLDVADRVKLDFTADNQLVVLYIAPNHRRGVADSIHSVQRLYVGV